MSCISPTAPDLLTTAGLPPDSMAMIAVISCGSTPQAAPAFSLIGIHCIARFTGTSGFHGGLV
ncbi:hypothetical protein EPKpNR5180_18920 [Klebsiella pneumoniae]